MLKVNETWKTNYPNAMKSWSINRGAICPIFKFSSDVRKVILILPHNRSQPT